MATTETDDGCPLCEGKQCDIWDDTDEPAREFIRTVELPDWQKWNKPEDGDEG